MLQLTTHRDFAHWRTLARQLLVDGVPPEAVLWADEPKDGSLLAGNIGEPDGVDPSRPPATVAAAAAVAPAVPRAFLDLAAVAACHRDPDRWNLLYRALWRLTRGGDRNLLDRLTDDDVARLHAMQRAVSRDRHKMTAFVRFRLVGGTGAGADGAGAPTPSADPAAHGRTPVERYVAWHRPDHYIVRLTAPFFARRFACLNWAILTPDDSAAWDGKQLTFGPGVPASAAPAGDDLEGLWQTYYANIFNPARIKVRAMKKELPVRHWPTLPEAGLIADLLNEAPRRVDEMIRKAKQAAKPPAAGRARPSRSDHALADDVGDVAGTIENADAGTNADADAGAVAGVRANLGSTVPDGPGLFAGAAAPSAESPPLSPRGRSAGWGAAAFIPPTLALPQLAAASKACRGCDLCDVGTQTVFGEGPPGATVMFVGEQPGDQEDRAGRPFVGPAGQLFNEALAEAGVVRDDCYVTNTVKHFKWEPRGARRIHAKPNAREVSACLPWLETEIRAVKPRMVVCLGSTAAQALLGRDFRVTTQRGRPMRTNWAPWTMATIHPSALLRIPDEALRASGYRAFVADLKLVAERLREGWERRAEGSGKSGRMTD